MARLYPGVYNIERNNHGLAALIACRRLGMRGIYAERPLLNAAGREVEPGKPGWLTTSVTKTLGDQVTPTWGEAVLRQEAQPCETKNGVNLRDTCLDIEKGGG